MYIDLSYDRTGHEHFAAYELSPGWERMYENQMKQIENSYSLGKSQISASLSNAKTAANASIKSAQIGANATIKATKIRAEVDRYGIDTNAAVEREKIGLAREEMMKIGIPSVLIDAWTAEKNYEVAKQTLGLNIAQTIAELRSTPDRYFMAADFEAVLPHMLNAGAGQAGGGMTGVASTTGTPNPYSLEGVVGALMGAGSSGSTSGPLGATSTTSGSTSGLFDQIKAMTGGTGTGATASGPGGLADNGSFKSALMQQGIQAWGHLPLDGTITQGDFNDWIGALSGPPSSTTPDPTDPRVVAAIAGAKQAGFDTSAYDRWLASRQPAAAPTAAPSAPQLQPNDTAYLASISGMMQGSGVDPFLVDKMSPTQVGILGSGLKRLGYDPNTEFWKAQQKRPGFGDPLAA